MLLLRKKLKSVLVWYHETKKWWFNYAYRKQLKVIEKQRMRGLWHFRKLKECKPFVNVKNSDSSKVYFCDFIVDCLRTGKLYFRFPQQDTCPSRRDRDLPRAVSHPRKQAEYLNWNRENCIVRFWLKDNTATRSIPRLITLCFTLWERRTIYREATLSKLGKNKITLY